MGKTKSKHYTLQNVVLMVGCCSLYFSFYKKKIVKATFLNEVKALFFAIENVDLFNGSHHMVHVDLLLKLTFFTFLCFIQTTHIYYNWHAYTCEDLFWTMCESVLLAVIEDFMRRDKETKWMSEQKIPYQWTYVSLNYESSAKISSTYFRFTIENVMYRIQYN